MKALALSLGRCEENDAKPKRFHAKTQSRQACKANKGVLPSGSLRLAQANFCALVPRLRDEAVDFFAPSEGEGKGPSTAGDPITLLLLLAFLAVFTLTGCQQKPATSSASPGPASTVLVTVNPGGPVVMKTASAEFDLLASGYLQAYLVKDGKRLTLDEPASVSEYLVTGRMTVGSRRDGATRLLTGPAPAGESARRGPPSPLGRGQRSSEEISKGLEGSRDKEIRDCALDFEHVRVSDAQGKLGA